MEPILKVVDLGVNYHTRAGNLAALRKVNFSVHAGQIVGLVGESGCGKSTFASAVMQLLPTNCKIISGRIMFKGRDLRAINSEDMRRLRGKEISMIFQDPMTSLNPVFRIGHQMADAILSHQPADRHLGRKGAQECAIRMLDKVGIPDPALRINDYPHQFSGGMRQRIMIATALQSNPALLLADEPTSALDVTLQAQIVDLIRALRDESQTGILYITHDLGVVAQLCDYVLVLYAGNIMESGEVYGIFKNPLHPYTRALLRSHPSRHEQVHRLMTIRGRVPSLQNLPVGCKFAERCDLAESICFRREPDNYRVDGQQVLCHAYSAGWQGKRLKPAGQDRMKIGGNTSPRKKALQNEEVLRIEQLETHFYDRVGLFGRVLGQRRGMVRAVDRVDLSIHRGETLALVGESGSGKTTLGRTVLRLLKPAGGDIIVEDQSIIGLTQSQVRPLRVRMQMIFQDPHSSLSPRKTVSDLLLEPFKIHGIEIENERNKVEELLEMVGLTGEQADKYPHQLSGGQARRVGIARALALQPDLIIADEPTAGLDVSVAAGVLNLLKDLRDRFNLTYVIITHNLDIIGFIADRIAVMYLGKIVEMGQTNIMLNSPMHPYTRALMSAVALPDPELRDLKSRIILEGEIPSSLNPPSGCSFHPRCPCRQEECMVQVPPLKEAKGKDGVHLVACHFPIIE